MIIETPEIVTVKIALEGGMECDVLFTQDEYSAISTAAENAGLSVERWLIDAAVAAARRLGDGSASSRGSA